MKDKSFIKAYCSSIGVFNSKVRNSISIADGIVNCGLYSPDAHDGPVVSSAQNVTKVIVSVDKIKGINEVSKAVVGVIINVDATVTASNAVVEAESDHGGQGAGDCASALPDDFVQLSCCQSRTP